MRNTIDDDTILYKRYKCKIVICEECKKELPRQISKIKLDIENNNPTLCKSCLLTKRNKTNLATKCRNCGVILDTSTEVRHGKLKTRHSTLCRQCFSKESKQRYREVKQQVIDHYGGKCNCCGETTLEFLTIDHVNNDGKIHRKKEPNNLGTNLYKKLIAKNFDVGYELQVLCWNCNEAKNYYGSCPHKLNN